jgi:hypothetical protein
VVDVLPDSRYWDAGYASDVVISIAVPVHRSHCIDVLVVAVALFLFTERSSDTVAELLRVALSGANNAGVVSGDSHDLLVAV